jgi:hypothetical protein
MELKGPSYSHITMHVEFEELEDGPASFGQGSKVSGVALKGALLLGVPSNW